MGDLVRRNGSRDLIRRDDAITRDAIAQGVRQFLHDKFPGKGIEIVSNEDRSGQVIRSPKYCLDCGVAVKNQARSCTYSVIPVFHSVR
jgi:hypothetical protein